MRKPSGPLASRRRANGRDASQTLHHQKDLREKISRKDAEKSLATLKTAGTSAIEMTEAKPAAPIIQA
jgi:hypothetical protein